MDTKFCVGLAAAMLTGGLTYLGANSTIPPTVVAGAVAIVAWMASWINARNNG